MPGQTDDPGNKADSNPTVDEIAEHNARWRGMCEAREPAKR